MTEKEINRQKQVVRMLREKGKNAEATDLASELSCRSMINSCLCYGDDFFAQKNMWDVDKQGYVYQSYAEDSAKHIGMDRVKRIYEEQKIDFEKATVHKNVMTDDEGLSYNSIQWADEV